MCGIVGIVNAPESITENKFRTAVDTIQHRGPDGSGIWTNQQGTWFGHRRLSILDLSDASAQPMHYLHYVLVFNGEIYNFLEIKKELTQKGYVFTTNGDAEVLIAAYDAWKTDAFTRFNGMWAFALWDTQKQTLFLSRDRFGKKPLFYYQSNDTLYFASEMKALLPFLPHPQPSKDFDWCVQNYFFYETTDKCLVEGIKRFPAGHFGYYAQNVLKLERYYFPLQAIETIPKTYSQQVERFKELFLDACRLRMRSDVPVGSALSGGLDSSAVACAMQVVAHSDQRIHKDWQHAFIHIFPNSFLDEKEYADIVVKKLGLQAVYIDIDGHTAWERLPQYLYYFEEIYNTSPVPMIETYQAARAQGVYVTLDGHGADELLAGYNNTLFEALFDAGLNLFAAKDILQTWYALFPTNASQLSDHKPWTLRRYLGYVRSRKKDFLQGVATQLGFRQDALGFYNRALFELYHVSILPTLLRNYDRYAMAAGIESRMPFLDYRLVSYCFGLPWQAKLRKGYTKAILRDALTGILPEKIRTRRSKIGFNTPIVDWMRSAWRTPLLDLVASKDFLESDIIDAPKVRAMIEHVIYAPAPTFSEGVDAWRILNPYLWKRYFLEKRNS